MASNLVFPDGVRLARLYELPGPEPDRTMNWSRIQAAEIRSGYRLSESADPRFAFYGQANVDAPKIWDIFRDLCIRLLGPMATLVMSEIDGVPAPVGMNKVRVILRSLEPHSYQLVHDGFLQFGLVHQEGNQLSEVFVTHTKHFQLWLEDANLLRSTMQQHGVPEVEAQQFIDEYPHTTKRLPSEEIAFQSPAELIWHMEAVLWADSFAELAVDALVYPGLVDKDKFNDVVEVVVEEIIAQLIIKDLPTQCFCQMNDNEFDYKHNEWADKIAVLTVQSLLDRGLVYEENFDDAVDIVAEEILVRLIMKDLPPQ